MNIFIFFIEIIILCIIMLSLSHFLGHRPNHSTNRNIPFESGMTSIGSVKVGFPTKFYVIAMFFIIFDIEAIYIYIWSIILREVGWVGFTGLIILIYFIIIKLLFLLKRNSL